MSNASYIVIWVIWASFSADPKVATTKIAISVGQFALNSASPKIQAGTDSCPDQIEP
jgi:hypothetical protein